MREDWKECSFEDLLDYEQPTKYIVESTKYSDSYKTPVLTAGKSFIKGYTNETEGVFNNLPTIIFDDFTTASQFVNFEFKVKSSAMKILVPTSKLVNMKFAYYAMQVNKVRNDTHKRYWISTYSKNKFLLPPLPIQRAIVTKIENLFASLDKGIADLKKAQEQLKVYRQAVLKKAFEGELTKEWREKQTNLPTAEELLEQIKKERQKHYEQQLEDWKQAVKDWKKNYNENEKPLKPQKPTNLDDKISILEDLSKLMILPSEWANVPLAWLSDNKPNSIVDGPFGSSINVNEDYKETGVPVIRMVNIRPLRFVAENLKFIIESKFQQLRRHNILSGDILIAKVGATIGDCCIYPENQHEGMLSTTGSCRVRLDKNIYSNKFLEYYIHYQKYKLKSIASQTAQPFLNMKVLKAYPAPFLNISEQHQIVREIESRLSVCDKVEQNISEGLEKSEALRQSILKKAFEGKLLSEAEIEKCKQAADYEPASLLLERIKKEKK
ncbi:MAG: restriction endonuclease subunit S [Bacteroidota bacterium]